MGGLGGDWQRGLGASLGALIGSPSMRFYAGDPFVFTLHIIVNAPGKCHAGYQWTAWDGLAELQPRERWLKKNAIVTSGLEDKPSFVCYVMFIEKVTKSGINGSRDRPYILFIIIILNLST